MDGSIYRTFFASIDRNYLHHHLLPSHNIIDMEAIYEKPFNEFDDDLDDPYYSQKDNKNFLNSFPCYKKFDYEAGLASVLYCGSGTCDDPMDLLRKKLFWAKKLKLATPKNPKQIHQNIVDYKKQKTGALSETSKKFLDQFFNDPEPNFKGFLSYNWLYNGGSISQINYNGNPMLLCGDYINDTYVLKLLELNEDLSEVIDSEMFNLKKQQPILQTCCKKKDDSIILSVRQKTRLSLLSTTNGKWALQLQWKKRVRKKKLITSMDINSCCEDIVVTDITHDLQNLNVYSIETGRKKFGLCRSTKAVDDTWNKVIYSDQGILFVERNSIHLVDTRTNSFAWNYRPSSVMEECDYINNIMESELNPNNIYLTMTHNLTQVDARMTKPVQKWTHMMKDVLQHGSVVADGDRELIILQSKNPENFIGITNEHVCKNNEYIYLSKSLPLIMKGIKESVRVAHYNELCLKPMLSNRFNASVTGCTLMKDNRGNINYFVANALGDIFKYKMKNILDDEIDDENKILDSIKKYEAHFENIKMESKFVPPKTVDMTYLIEKKKLQKDKWLQQKTFRKKCLREPKPWKYQEMYAIESLKCYKDFLAGKILEVWGVDDDDDRDLDEQISVADKVEGWLESF